MPEDERRRWKVTRRDSFTDIPGELVEADEDAGTCKMKDKEGKITQYVLQPGGIAIVPKSGRDA